MRAARPSCSWSCLGLCEFSLTNKTSYRKREREFRGALGSSELIKAIIMPGGEPEKRMKAENQQKPGVRAEKKRGKGPVATVKREREKKTIRKIRV